MNNLLKRRLEAARYLWSNLRLDPKFHPVSHFGEPSKWGAVFTTNGNKIMKIVPWSESAEREMRVARIAGNSNVGPKVYNTRVWTPPNAASRNAAQNNVIKAFTNKNNKTNKVVVITMNKVPRAKPLYNAINNGTIRNFSKVENAIKRMHAAGIHHGNLHGYNILVYLNNSGNVKVVPINFGASNYNKSITNSKTALNYLSKMPGQVTHPYYFPQGRRQPTVANEYQIENLRKYFNKHKKVN